MLRIKCNKYVPQLGWGKIGNAKNIVVSVWRRNDLPSA